MLGELETAAVLVARICSLSRGYSGVREVVLERLCDLLNHRILPRIPSRGSVGASGDLTPLSYVVAVLVGEREVSYRGEVLAAGVALRHAELEPITLMPKESLALMNGTSVMTGLGVLAHAGARRFARWATALTAMAVDGMRGHPDHFDARVDGLKPHAGQQRCAKWLREDLERASDSPRPQSKRLQDRYSLRCAPHVIGPLLDAVDFAGGILVTELGSVNDNPIVDPDTGDFVNGGNFYGGHVAMAMDTLKTQLANVAGLLDRQLALLCDPDTSGGLSANLVVPGPRATSQHGFKAMQISASALAAEACKLTMPASVFSRSTECHNQDVVSMGTHAARDCLEVLELAENVAAIATLACCQALDLRGAGAASERGRLVLQAVRNHVAAVEVDRRQDLDIAEILRLHREGALPWGEA
jgi:histidine ammonia-lyase